jgi:predicted metalloprotease
MRTEGQRRSSNFEDRGSGRRGGAGVPLQAVAGLVRFLGVKGTLIAGLVMLVAFVLMPAGLKEQILGALTGSGEGAPSGPGAASVCEASQASGAACDFSRAVLGSTEDVWTPLFSRGALPAYGSTPGAYRHPTLVVFANGVSTSGCGNATSAVGPFYCPADQKLYIDPSFYGVMEKRLRAPGDFAQAYVLAHEVGHHVQNLIGSTRLQPNGETSNQASVRVELQADCFAGVWGRSAQSTLEITDEDLGEALTAAHAIGDDTLGHSDERKFTHGSSEQRKRWFRRGFESGDPRQCDTFAVRNYREL